MRIGLALAVFDLAAWRHRRVDEIAEEALWAEAVGFDSIWVSDHFFFTRSNQRVAGLEPMALLSYLAAKTRSMTLGAMVLCNNFRPIGQLAREVATLMDASRGQVILGMGCGSQDIEHRAFGLPYDRRVTRLDESLTVLPRLLAGERVTFSGSLVNLEDASVTTAGQVPPIWLAAFGPRMIEIAARRGQGWAGNWNGPDVEGFRQEAATVRAVVDRHSKSNAGFDIVVNMLAVPTERASSQVARAIEQVLPGGPAEGRIAIGSGDELGDILNAYQEAGATYAVVAPSPRQFSYFPETDRDQLARLVRVAKALE